MAKAVAICKCEKCGKTFEMTAYKHNRREAVSWVEWAVGRYTVCTDCWKAEKEAADNDKNSKLPEITIGSPKQIAWAIKIRLSAAEKFDAMRPNVRDDLLDIFDAYVTHELSNSDAKFWIDNRYDVDDLAWAPGQNNVFLRHAYEFVENGGAQ